MNEKILPYFEVNTGSEGFLEWHDAVEIVFMLCGKANLYINDKHYDMQERDIVIFNIGQIHCMDLQEGGKALSFYIPTEYFAQYIPEEIGHFWECYSFLGSGGSQEYYDEIREALCAAFLADREKERLEYHSRILLLLQKMDKYFLKSKENSYGGRSKQLESAVKYMAEHFRENIKLSDLASITHFSDSYLSRIFRQELGMTYKQYLTRLRVNKGMVLLNSTSWPVTKIAYYTGFNSTNSFITAFKEICRVTPGQYRQRVNEKADGENTGNALREEGIFDLLLQYREKSNDKDRHLTRDVNVDVTQKGLRLEHTWKRMLNIAYAQDLLTARVQEQVIKIQKEIHFSMVRFMGICNDSMMVLHKDKNGEITFHFDYVDEILDFLLVNNLKPCIVLGFMPEALVKKKYRAYFNSTWVSMPNDMEIWDAMIKRLVSHIVERYGIQEVQTWIFQPWCHPEVGPMIETYTMEEYLEFYRKTYLAVKYVDGKLTTAGPDCRLESVEWQRAFLKYCIDQHCMPEVLSFQSFHFERKETQSGHLSFRRREDTLNGIISNDPFYLLRERKKLDALLREYGAENIPVMLSCWNNTSWQRDYSNDTAAKAAFLYKDLWQTYDMWYAIGYWFFLDYVSYDEVAPSIECFHGGFGLMTSDGIPKSGYRALELLKRAGDYLLLNEEGIAVTKKESDLGIYLYNCCEFNQSYCYQHIDGVSYYKRYGGYLEKENILYKIHLRNIPPGMCTIHRYIVGKNAGSAYDEWLKMGAPEDMNREEANYLRAHTLPDYHIENVYQKGELELVQQVKPHEIIYLEVCCGK